MREIKFRGWDKKLKRMAYNIQNYYDNLGYDYTPTEVDATFSCFLNNEFQEVMQFSGLLDKQGKEIYEGDVIRGRSGWTQLIDSLENHAVLLYVSKVASACKVIGNIYEGLLED